MKEKIEVVWPSGRCAQPLLPLAPRLHTLENKTICGVFNGVFYFDQTWPLIQQLLSKRYPGIKFVGWEEFGIIPDKELDAVLKKHGCDAVISGRGC